MFTGIIEEIGTIKSINAKNNEFEIIIKANKVLQGTNLGDSICTNGVCLTVTDIYDDSFKAYVMPETFRKTSLGNLKSHDKVNLERALSLNDRLGGHIVSGHVDSVGYIYDIKKEERSNLISIKADKDILKYVIYKGSIAIDGISLTVFYVDDDIFKVSIIPQTKHETTLLTKSIGDKVNLECDVIGKYVEKLLNISDLDSNKESKIDENFLRINGYL